MFLVFSFGVLTTILLGASFYHLLKRRPLAGNSSKTIPAMKEVMLHPEDVTVNLSTYHSLSISGYSLKMLSHLYYTVLGKAFLSRIVISSSKLNLFADRVLSEPPILQYTPPPPAYYSKEEMKESSILISLVRSHSSQNKTLKSVSDFYTTYETGRVTPLDVANAVLVAIEESNKGAKPLRAIVASDHDVVLSMAKASTERWKSGSQLSLLDGVPVSIKEDFCMDCYPCYCGTTFVPSIMKDMPESAVVRKLLEAGAVVIGVTNMPEFGANSIGSSENHSHKQPRNPHNTDFFPGGSSSGCAVSVAAGLCPISVGGDGGGSGRVPAAVCGVYALKLTQGLLDDTGSYGSIFSFSTVSPLTSSPLDLAVFMEVVCKSDPNDERKISSVPFDSNVLSDVRASTLSGVTIGIYWDWIQTADKETTAVFNEAVEKLKTLGATVTEIRIPELEELRVAHTITAVTELSVVMSEDVDKHFSEIGPGPLLVTAMGRGFSATECINAMKQRTRTVSALKAIFKEVDIIATPTAGCPVPRITPEYFTRYGIIDSESIGKLEIFTFLANFIGSPAITVPIGTLNEELKLPVGLQLVAPWHHESQLIKYAMAIEASGQFPQLEPAVFYDIIHPSSD